MCRRYTEIAQKKLTARDKQIKAFKHLAWLTLDSEDGQAYWLAMNLMGRYAAANHEVIHRNVTKLAGAQAIATVENHHNFAWQERSGRSRVDRASQGRHSGSRRRVWV